MVQSKSSRKDGEEPLDATLVRIQRLERIGTGLCFIFYPVAWIFCFWAHPHLLEPRMLKAKELISLQNPQHGTVLIQIGHLLVALDTVFMIPIALHYMYLLGKEDTGSATKWLGFFGTIFAILGACMMMCNNGALHFILAAVDSLSPNEYEQILPVLEAYFSWEGWKFLFWGMLLMALGVLLQIMAMMRAKSLPNCHLRLLFVAFFFIGFPKGPELINLVAAIVMAIAMVPYGMKLVLTPPPNTTTITVVLKKE